METEENIEVGSNFHKNLIRSDSLHKDIADEDGPTIRDYSDYVCYRRKRAAIIGIVVVLVLAAVSFTVVYFTRMLSCTQLNPLPHNPDFQWPWRTDGLKTLYSSKGDKWKSVGKMQGRGDPFPTCGK